MATEPISLAAASPLIAKLVAAFANSIKNQAARTKQKIELVFKKGFTGYISENVNRFSFVKTIISSSTPISLLSIYVNLHLAHPNASLRDDDFLDQISKYKNVLFCATAGAGKSMLMRYLYLRFLEVQTDRLPIFIELRDLNQPKYADKLLHEYIRSKIQEYIEGFSDQQVHWALKTGKFILFLDGFDEIDHDKRKQRESEINDLSARYSHLWTFVSSRPAETFSSWEKFFVFRVQPFTKKQVELLISKISYDAEIKALFNKKLAEGLYETHKEFLTNPLLTIMMLITLEQFAEVPAKVHLFYEYAFEALFGRHDVTKGGFQRKRHTTLALDDFKRLFAYFCMITYIQEAYIFSASKVLEIIQQSISSSQIDVDKVGFCSDLTESTCMLVMDGLDYTFSHRSFQEYFAAYFLSRVKVDEFSRAIPQLIQRGVFDNVLTMVSEMNREKFEEVWALPTLNKLCDRVKGLDANKNWIAYATALLGGKPNFAPGAHVVHAKRGGAIQRRFMIIFDHDSTQGEAELSESRIALYSIYGIFDQIHGLLKNEKIKDNEILDGIENGTLFKNDPRFEALRNSKADNKAKHAIRIPLNENDSKVLRDSHFGLFILIESEILPKIRAEFEYRVMQRNRGLESIFSTRSRPKSKRKSQQA